MSEFSESWNNPAYSSRFHMQKVFASSSHSHALSLLLPFSLSRRVDECGIVPLRIASATKALAECREWNYVDQNHRVTYFRMNKFRASLRATRHRVAHKENDEKWKRADRHEPLKAIGQRWVARFFLFCFPIFVQNICFLFFLSSHAPRIPIFNSWIDCFWSSIESLKQFSLN